MADLNSSLASLLQVPGLQELLNQQITQQRQMMPLHTGINQQAANMLPNSAFAGGAAGRPNMAAIPAATYSTPPPSGGMSTAMKLAVAGAGVGGLGALAKALGNGGGSGGNLGAIASLFKHLFGGGDTGGVPIPGGEFDPNAVYGGPDGPQYPAAPNYGPADPYVNEPAGSPYGDPNSDYGGGYAITDGSDPYGNYNDGGNNGEY